MACGQCQGIEQFFDDRTAARELRRLRRRGPSASTRILLDALRNEGAEGATFLDVGGGVGAIQHDLMAAGAAGGHHVDASPAYLRAAREEAERRGNADRIRYHYGDAIELMDRVPEVDFVTLDRVLCCYHDMPALVDATAPKARRLYGIVFPREGILMRAGTGAINFFQRLRRHPFNVFLHGTRRIMERVTGHGMEVALYRNTLLWQVAVFRRRSD
ncbi:MAG: class I SAM-dependent methyltransferase [Gemmatimonadota bacterium]